MRSHAKASSAGPTLGQGVSPSSLVRGAFVTRGASGDIDGSGARSHRGRTNALALALAALILLALAPLSQAKVPINGFGVGKTTFSPPLYGGEFGAHTVSGIAVNSSGNGAPAGTSYVLDPFIERLQRFSPAGAFQRTWGQDVIASSVNEEQTVSVTADAGTYTLSFKGEITDPIPYNAGLGTIVASLAALPAVGGSANIGTTFLGTSFVFRGALAGVDQPQPTADTSQLSGIVSITTLANGTSATGGTGTGFEICTTAAFCKGGSSSGTTANGGQLGSPQGVAVNQAGGHVYVTESGNRRVSEFDADGSFIRAWGWDVITSGQPNDTGTGFEICEVVSECKQGASGANGGQFGTTLGSPTVDTSGNVWIADSANRRIQKFSSSGAFIAAYGHNVDALGGGGGLEECASLVSGACQAGTQGSGAGQFSANNPKEIAFDAAGNLYAIDSGNNRVQKFDPTLLASAINFAASLFSTYSTGAPEHVISTQGGVRLVFSLNNNVTANPAERQLIEVDPADTSTVKDTSLVGLGINVNGLAANSATGNLYLTTGSGVRKVLVLSSTQPPAPAVTMKPVITKTDTTATLSAIVDPEGGWLGCTFQYSTDQSIWTDVAEPECASLAPDGLQGISQSIIGLDPNTHYFARLQISRPLIANSTTTSAVMPFDTDAVPPVVTNVGGVQVTDTSARLIGTIDPRHSATGYVFEYGTTPALGSSTAPLDIGGGTTPTIVSRVIDGLGKDTTYYFRLVATNAAGTTSSSSSTLRTRATPLPLPENRAWEMVSPPEKNFTDASKGAIYRPQAAISEDGNGVGFCTTALFGEPSGRMTSACAPYISRRTASGWQTSNPFPGYCRIDPITGTAGGDLQAHVAPDFSHFVIDLLEIAGCPDSPVVPGASVSADRFTQNLYLDDLSTGAPSYQLINPTFAEPGDFFFQGGNHDFSRVVYRSTLNQTAPPDSPPQAAFRKLYLWEREGTGSCVQPGGCLELLGRDTSDDPFEADTSLPANGSRRFTSAVAADGRRIFFVVDPLNASNSELTGDCARAQCEIYMREEGSTTYEVSVSECTFGACGAPQTKADTFLSATESGEHTFFTSCARLTDASSAQGCDSADPWVHQLGRGASGSKLYRWERTAAPGHHLVDLTVDNDPSDGSQPEFGGLIGESTDGNIVFFTARGRIVSGQPTTQGEKLYRWHWNGGSPEVDYLGSYEAQLTAFDGDANTARLWQLVTPDGKYLLVYTKLAYDPVADQDSDADAYRWDEEGGWTCVSCQAPGAPSRGGVYLQHHALLSYEALYRSISSTEPKFVMSEDGQRVFFGTPDALVPEDVNGEAGCPQEIIENVSAVADNRYACEDVYEWNDGTVSLISSGTSDGPALLAGASRSGDDVLFYTKDRLVGWDVDNNVDLYDARVGGGFPEPPPQPASCEGEACRGPGTVAPPTSGAGTAAFEGPGNPVAKQGKPRKPRKHRRNQKKHKRAKHRTANHDRRAAR